VTATVVVLATAGSPEEAERIATTLVEARLAACVNLVTPVTSIYRWQGAVERASEVLLVIKTRRTSTTRLVARLRALHSYELPEVIVLPIVAGSAPYLRWLVAETAPIAATPRRRPRRRTPQRVRRR